MDDGTTPSEFRYEDKDWQKIAAYLPTDFDQDSVRRLLEDAARMYLDFSACSFHGARREALRAHARQVIDAGTAFLGVLTELRSGAPFGLLHEPLINKNGVLQRYEDPEVVERRSAEMLTTVRDVIAAAEWWITADKETAPYCGQPKREKSARRSFIKNILSIWTDPRIFNGSIDRAGMKQALDFVEAVSEPVLLPSDSFSGVSRDAARDALHKVLEAIRREKEISQA